MNYLPCTADHLYAIEPDPSQVVLVSNLMTCLEGATTMASDEGELLACWGCVKLWDGVGEVWTILSTKVLKHHPVALMRAIQRYLTGLETQGYKRFNAMVLKNSAGDGEWMDSLGFEIEGQHHNWGPGGEGTWLSYGRIS